MAEELPPQTAHKAIAGGAGGALGAAVGTALAGWLELDGDVASACIVVCSASGAALFAWAKRNWVKGS